MPFFGDRSNIFLSFGLEAEFMQLGYVFVGTIYWLFVVCFDSSIGWGDVERSGILEFYWVFYGLLTYYGLPKFFYWVINFEWFQGSLMRCWLSKTIGEVQVSSCSMLASELIDKNSIILYSAWVIFRDWTFWED